MEKIVMDDPNTAHEKLMNTARRDGIDVDIVLNDKKRISLSALAATCAVGCSERKSGKARHCGACADEDRECVMAILMRIAVQAASLRESMGRIENQGDGWISTADRLPSEEDIMDNRGEFIVIIDGYALATTLCFDGEEWRDQEGDGDCYKVTYWMPLPKPPEGVGKEGEDA